MSKFNDLVAKKYKEVLGEQANVPPPEAVTGGDDTQAADTTEQPTPPQSDAPPAENKEAELSNNNIVFYTKSMINVILNADKISEDDKLKLSKLENTITNENAFSILQQITDMVSNNDPDSLPQDGTEQ